MNQVDKVVANVAISGQRTESALATAQLEFWDKDGKVLTDTHITADAEQVEVTIPVLKMKEVPITFEYTGVPPGLRYKRAGRTALAGEHSHCRPAERVDALESVSAACRPDEIQAGRDGDACHQPARRHTQFGCAAKRRRDV